MSVFLHISLTDPHPPLTPPEAYYERYIHRKLPEPIVGDWAEEFSNAERGLDPDAHRICLDTHAMQCCRAGYYGLINFVDDQIGRLMHYVRSSEPKDTFILFASDHGEMLGDHHLFRKTFPYEGSARVPFLIKAPESMGLPTGGIIDSPVGLQDVMPTQLDVAGVEIPDTCTGRSVLPLVRGNADGWRDVLHGEHAPCYAPDMSWHYLVGRQYKYIWNPNTGREQLFDILKDPGELHDLARHKDFFPVLETWRGELTALLKDRPEGFVSEGRLVAGRPYSDLIPGYEPNKHYPFL